MLFQLYRGGKFYYWHKPPLHPTFNHTPSPLLAKNCFRKSLINFILHNGPSLKYRLWSGIELTKFINVLPLSTNFLLDVETVPTAWYLVFHFFVGTYRIHP